LRDSRVEVGGALAGSAQYTPTFFEIFGRHIILDSVTNPRWIDLPFTNEECMVSDKTVTLKIGNSRDTTWQVTVINSIKIYGKLKSVLSNASNAETIEAEVCNDAMKQPASIVDKITQQVLGLEKNTIPSLLTNGSKP